MFLLLLQQKVSFCVPNFGNKFLFLTERTFYIYFSSFLGIPSITAFEKNGLKIIFEFDKPPDNPQMIIINLIATNHSLAPINDFLFQAAVPKVNICDSYL